jgi:hypothetical protein
MNADKDVMGGAVQAPSRRLLAAGKNEKSPRRSIDHELPTKVGSGFNFWGQFVPAALVC